MKYCCPVQVQQQLDSLRQEQAEAEQAREAGDVHLLPTRGSQQEMLDTLLPPDVLEGMRDAHEEELRVCTCALVHSCVACEPHKGHKRSPQSSCQASLLVGDLLQGLAGSADRP